MVVRTYEEVSIAAKCINGLMLDRLLKIKPISEIFPSPTGAAIY
jgi:hypothetical protein